MEFLESFDQGLWNFIQSKRKPWLDPVLALISWLALPVVLLALAGATALFLLIRRRPAPAGFVLASCVGAFFIAGGLQLLIDRPPPEVMVRPLEEPPTSSFPSTEMLTGTATYTALALALYGRLGRGFRTLTPLTAIVLVLLIGLARAMIGGNYPTDLAAGWLAGLAWTLVCFGVAEKWAPPSAAAVPDQTGPAG